MDQNQLVQRNREDIIQLKSEMKFVVEGFKELKETVQEIAEAERLRSESAGNMHSTMESKLNLVYKIVIGATMAVILTVIGALLKLILE